MGGHGRKQCRMGLAIVTFALALAQCLAFTNYASSTTSTPRGNYACPNGWAEHEGACLWVSDSEATQNTATSVCNNQGGFLAHIFSVSRNQFLKGLIPNASTPVWIGLKRDSYYNTYTNSPYTWRGAGGSQSSMAVALWSSNPSTSQSYSELCVTMKADGLWYGDLSCSSSYRYICEKKPDCARGWTGMMCSEVCHCASFECGSSFMTCPYGCQPGWTGSRCDQEKKKTEVVYYCENATDTGPQLVLRMDVKGVNYMDFRSLDENGVVKSNCSKSSFILTSNPTAYSLTVPAPYSPVCPGYLVPNTTWTYQWTFWLAEFKNVLSEHDFIFTATCDFTKAETMQRPAEFYLNSVPSGRVVPVHPSHEVVKLLVVEPDTTSDLRPLSTAVIGTRVRLVMTLGLQSGIKAKGVSPKDCFVSSLDGSEVYNITDSKGCATGATPTSKLTGNGTLQQTEVFSIFSFRQSHQLLFTCSFDFCFSDGDRNCTDRCIAITQPYYNGMYPYSRFKRSASETSDNLVSAVITVVPRELPRDEAVMANSASSQAAPGMVVGVVAVVALVVVVLSVVTAHGRSALCGARRHEWAAVPQRPESF